MTSMAAGEIAENVPSVISNEGLRWIRRGWDGRRGGEERALAETTDTPSLKHSDQKRDVPVPPANE